MVKHVFAAGALLLALCTGVSSNALAQSEGKVKAKEDKEKMKVKAKKDKTSSASATGAANAAPGSMASSSAGVMVGGAMMTPDKDIVANALGSSDHTTLVTAVKAADLVSTLQGPGPFTVFAPTNAAFAKLPAGTVETLVKPENKATLTKVLTYHVVPGALKAADLTDGQTLTTVQGETLTVSKKGNSVTLRDAKGGTANVTIPNVISSNGVTHVVDTVLMPAK